LKLAFARLLVISFFIAWGSYVVYLMVMDLVHNAR